MTENKKTIVEVPLGSTPLGEREEPKSSEKDNLEERSIEGGATDIISQESKSKALTKSRQSALAKYFDKEWWRASKAEKGHCIAVPLEWKNYYGLEKEYLQKLTTEREELSLGTPYERVEKLPHDDLSVTKRVYYRVQNIQEYQSMNHKRTRRVLINYIHEDLWKMDVISYINTIISEKKLKYIKKTLL